MTYLDAKREDLEDMVARTGLCDDMFFSLHEEAQDRIDAFKGLVGELFNSLERRHADDLVDDYRERFGSILGDDL